MSTETYPQFMMKWAKEAFNQEDWFNGTMSGGIDPPRNIKSCVVTGANTVEILYDLPELAGVGIKPGGYHVIDPHKIRSDEFVFGEDGEITCNGRAFPGEWKDEPWTRDAALEFEKAYEKDWDRFQRQEKMHDVSDEHTSDPEPIGDIIKRVMDDLQAKRQSAQEKADALAEEKGLTGSEQTDTIEYQ